MSAGEGSPSEAEASLREPNAAESRAPNDEGVSLKRKSLSAATPPPEETSPKRQKLEDGSGSTDRPSETREPKQNGASEKGNGAGAREETAAARDDQAPAEQTSSPARRRASESIPEHPPVHGRKGGFTQEEKKRGRRLFGSLLGTLSQTATNSQQKRRQEIERRQQEKAQQQKVEDDKRRSEKLAKINHIRKVEQIMFEEQVMRTRHANLLAIAHSLHTESEPRLFYRPWELTPEQETIIHNQILEAESQVEREVQRFKRLKEQRLKSLGVSVPSSSATTVGEPVEERSNAAQAESTNRNPDPTPKSNHDKDHEETGEVVVEAEEDTVIY